MWATDLMYVVIGGRTYYLVSFLDEYSRLIVHHALCASMDGITVSIDHGMLSLIAPRPKRPQRRSVALDSGGGPLRQPEPV